MKKFIILILLAFSIVLFSVIFINYNHDEIPSLNKNEGNIDRIISLSPSSTEILFALGLGEKVVGVTNFCNYPEAARHKSRVGGYLDPNYEAIAALRPDLVIILPEQQKIKNFLSELKINCLTVDNKTIQDILTGIQKIGEVCQAENQASQLIGNLRKRMENIRHRTTNLSKPGVLISIGRNIGIGTLADVYAAGKDTYYTELIRYAGGINVLESSTVSYPLITAEGIINLDPDIIIDLIFGTSNHINDPQQIINDWSCVSEVKAVKNQRVYVINEGYSVIPGPRFILLLEKLARLIHPEIDWGE